MVITPSGHLRVEESSAAIPALSQTTSSALRQAFSQSSAEGLLLLASDALDRQLPADFLFWRGFARDVLQRLCQLGEAPVEQWATLEEPSQEEMTRLVVQAPPMRGLENLSENSLRTLWRELRALVAARARQHPQGAAAWLQTVHPIFHLLGRVTFHLAENKRDPARPFAFLATFTHRMSSEARLQHLPLGEALKTYAGTRQHARLTALLEPVRRASQQSELVKELLE